MTWHGPVQYVLALTSDEECLDADGDGGGDGETMRRKSAAQLMEARQVRLWNRRHLAKSVWLEDIVQWAGKAGQPAYLP